MSLSTVQFHNRLKTPPKCVLLCDFAYKIVNSYHIQLPYLVILYTLLYSLKRYLRKVYVYFMLLTFKAQTYMKKKILIGGCFIVPHYPSQPGVVQCLITLATPLPPVKNGYIGFPLEKFRFSTTGSQLYSGNSPFSSQVSPTEDLSYSSLYLFLPFQL